MKPLNEYVVIASNYRGNTSSEGKEVFRGTDVNIILYKKIRKKQIQLSLIGFILKRQPTIQ